MLKYPFKHYNHWHIVSFCVMYEKSSRIYHIKDAFKMVKSNKFLWLFQVRFSKILKMITAAFPKFICLQCCHFFRIAIIRLRNQRKFDLLSADINISVSSKRELCTLLSERVTHFIYSTYPYIDLSLSLKWEHMNT